MLAKFDCYSNQVDVLARRQGAGTAVSGNSDEGSDVKQGRLAKTSMWVAGGLVGLVVIASVVLSFMDWNQYRGRIAGLASDALDMDVVLNGRVAVSLLPRPAVSVEGVEVWPKGMGASGDSKRLVAVADRIAANASLVPLLTGTLEVGRLDLEGVAVTLAQGEDGAWGLKGWPASAEATEPTAEGEASPLSIGKLALRDGRVTLEPKGATPTVINDIDLDLEGTLPDGPLDFGGSLKVADRPIDLEGRLRPGKTTGDRAGRLKVSLKGGSATLSGQIETTGAITGRVEAGGDDLFAFVNDLMLAAGQGEAVQGPAKPWTLDMQINGNDKLMKLTGRDLQAGSTRGRFDLTLVPGETQRLGGSFGLGIIDMADWADVTPVASDAPASSEWPLRGAVEFSVEGIKSGEALAQRVEGQVDFVADGVSLPKVQALLPGATTLVVSRGQYRLADGSLAANLKAETGSLPTLLKSAGIVLENVPAGRLATASVDGRLGYGASGWRVDDLAGKLDTTSFTGSAAGRADGSLTRLNLSLDTLNLDAYLPAVPAAEGEAEPLAKTLADALGPLGDAGSDINVAVGSMIWQGQAVKDMRLAAKAARGRIDGLNARFTSGSGSLALAGSLRGDEKNWTADLKASPVNFPVSVFTAFAPDSAPLMDALKLNTLTGDVTLSGPLDKMRMSASLAGAPGTKVEASGALALNAAGDGLSRIDIQGNAEHPDLAPAVALYGWDGARKLPAKLTYAVSQEGATEPYKLRVGGSVAGGKIVASGSAAADGSGTYDLSFEHAKAIEALRAFGLDVALPAPNQPLSAKATLGMTADGGMEMRDMDLKNGPSTLGGSIRIDGQERISGALKAANWSLDGLIPEDDGSAKTAAPEATEPASPYSGNISLALTDITYKGQSLTAPNARVVFTDKGSRLNFGDKALLNAKPLAGQFVLGNGRKPRMVVKLDADLVDIAGALVSSGLSSVIDGSAKVSLDLTARGNDMKSILKTLKGTGSIDASSGALKFMAINGLIQDIRNAKSGQSFLGLIGQRLRTGTTDYSGLKASFSVDGGVALIENFEASGGWGKLHLDGQANLVDQLLDLKGELAMSEPKDATPMPVSYKGPMNAPVSSFSSRSLEKLVLSDIERRFRSGVFKELEATDKQDASDKAPGAAVLGTAFDLLSKLKKKQEAEKKEEAEEADPPK